MSPLQPSVEDFACILHKCRKERNVAQALHLHVYMHENGLETHTLLGNYLVSMLVEVGSMCYAQQVFDKLEYQNESSWTCLIIGYVKHGDSPHALNLYQKMQEDQSLHPSGYAFVALLKACAMLTDVERGSRLHDEISRKGFLETNIFVGSALVDMYAKCGSLLKAQEVFDKLPVRNVVSWNAIISGYVEHSRGKEALNCFEQMHHEGISPNPVTFVCSLKACGSIKATAKGQEIHAEIDRKGLLERNIFVGSALVDMYTKCGSLEKAQEVFDKLPFRNVVSWNALITGYAEHGCGAEALTCFEQMQHEGISPDGVTFVCSLKACTTIRATNKGRELHARIASKVLLERDMLIGSTLVDMYAKCGFLAKAQEVFDKLPVQDVVSWTALIAGYAEHRSGEEVLNCLKHMQHQGISPGAVTLVFCLKSCGSIGVTDKGLEIHAEIAKQGLEGDILFGRTLIDMYTKCGLLAEAQLVFDKLSDRTVVSWNALIAGYVEHGQGEEALKSFEEMQHEGICMDSVTLVCSLKACGSIGATDKGQEIHAEIALKGLEIDVFVSSTLVDMYAKCGLLVEAQEVFDKLPVRTLVAWTALIAGYAEHGRGEEALYCFKQLQKEGIHVDAVTFVCSLKACGSIGATDTGREIHAEIARKGFLEKYSFIGISLVDMYAKCGSLAEAQGMFDKLPVREVVLWTALIAGYAEHGCGGEALDCFKQMQHEGVSPNAVTLVCSLRACSSIGATVKGRDIHAEIVVKGLERELFVGNTLVDMYAKWGLLAEAQEVFDKLPVQKVVSWTALIVGYAEHGCGDEALYCLEQMQHEGISADAVTFVCSLTACGSSGATCKGREIHADLVRKGFEKELPIGNTLVNMYGKCGLLATAQKVFDRLPAPDVVSWNALIAAYADFGESQTVFHIFDRMIRQGIKPDQVTFVSVLNACNHAGLVDKGQMFFEAIGNDYGFIPTSENYTCMADLLGRAGCIDKAVTMIKKMPFHPGIVVWHTILGACQKWGNVELARHAFEHAVQLDEKGAAAHVSMSNIYTDSAMQEVANKVEAFRVEKQAWKRPGHFWWTDTHRYVHSFLVGDKRHS